jgi:hypothetical protein
MTQQYLLRMFNATGIVAVNAVMEYTKERIIMCVNDSIYEFATTATSLPTAVYHTKTQTISLLVSHQAVLQSTLQATAVSSQTSTSSR